LVLDRVLGKPVHSCKKTERAKTMTKSEDGADLVAAISATSSKKAPGSFLQAFGKRIVKGRMRKGWTRVERIKPL